ncbi:mediator of RNA polymerase II transcription subunit 25-like isoform X2 [Photinus pyralis]|nr:mediator of RNA polymerase II transcription subunit 25-like isoform X2 [Photinus pyralis]
MVLGAPELTLQADVIFVVEGTAVNGAYINDLKTNYIIPSLEYFSQGNLEEINYLSESANSLYGIVIYQAADCLPHPSTDTIGPFSSSGKVLNAFERLELIGGKGESHANIAEGLATALQCFEELQQKRDASSNAQQHCILVCNSPPYSLPVLESHTYSGKTAEQLAAILQERGINLSVISPRKIPSLYKLFEKAGGDLSASQTKNYAKDPRHLVLLKGFSLKERPISPPPGNLPNATQLSTTALPLPSLPSPVANIDSPISTLTSQSNQNLMGNSVTGGVGVQQNVGQSYRPPNPQGIIQLPNHTPGMVNVGMVNAARSGIIGNTQYPTPAMQVPPGYHTATGAGRPQNRWPTMLPPQTQQRPQFIAQGQQQVNTTQGSALIAQLTQPPSSAGVNQFPQIGTNASMNAQQQQQLRMNMLSNQAAQQNVQTSLPQNVQTTGINQTAGIMSTGLPQPSPISQTSNPSQIVPPNQVVTSQSQATVGQQSNQSGLGRERHTIWQGLLEWIEKPKNSSDSQKITRHVPCQVSANTKDGEPELKTDGWPPKLIMQLMPKQLIGNIGGAYLKNSKSVLFHPQSCEALESLTKVMSSGFAGCVHFTSVPNPNACDIKVLILLYTAEKRAYLGFIPNDQTAFVDRLRKVIQQQKSTQMLRQGQGPATAATLNPQSVGQSPLGGSIGTPPQLPVPNTSQTTTQQQSLMMSQTNTMAMGGGQITQNIVSASSPSGAGLGGVLGQNIPTSMQPRLRMQGIQQGSTQVNQSGGNASMSPGMMGVPLQRPPFDNNLEAARQQNLEKINQLKQTLEAAQQQEQQYKSQLERISHMKTQQLQEALQIAQQQEMQYKILDGPNPHQQQQQRMMRPMMGANNPGLRHLLQQQPQYRQQLMGMQGGIGGAGPRPQMGQQMQNTPGGNSQQPFDDVGNFDFM